MLDAFKKTISGQGPSRKAADELEEMLLKARVERAGASTALCRPAPPGGPARGQRAALAWRVWTLQFGRRAFGASVGS